MRGTPRGTPDTSPTATPPAVDPTPFPPALQPPPAAPLQNPEAAKPPRTRRVQKIVPPEFRDYTVKKGDTGFPSIAARPEVFGDARKATAIAKSNPLADPSKLKPGVTVLKIPVDPENIQGKPVWVDEVVAEGLPDVPPTAPQEPKPAPAGKTYTIQPDDTLWEISKRFYGSGAKWKLIAEANKDVIPNPDRPPRGVTIRIPPEP
jgi:nucleoid-associated protein YgaU